MLPLLLPEDLTMPEQMRYLFEATIPLPQWMQAAGATHSPSQLLWSVLGYTLLPWRLPTGESESVEVYLDEITD